MTFRIRTMKYAVGVWLLFCACSAFSREATVNNIPKFLPVVGNHDMTADGGSDAEYMKNVLIPALGDIAQPMEKGSANYHVDWKNVRFIMVDQ